MRSLDVIIRWETILIPSIQFRIPEEYSYLHASGLIYISGDIIAVLEKFDIWSWEQRAWLSYAERT